jgi:hypothetical protein
LHTSWAVVGTLAGLVSIAWYLSRWGWTAALRGLIPVLAVFALVCVALAALWNLAGVVVQAGFVNALIASTCLEIQAVAGLIALRWLRNRLHRPPRPPASSGGGVSEGQLPTGKGAC